MKKKKKYKQLPLFPEIKPEEPKKRTGSKSLSYNTLSKIAEKRKKELLLAQIAKAESLEEIETLEQKIASLSASVIPAAPKIKRSTIADLIIRNEETS